ncbi:HAMP domain-containing sensor histidine kinase [Bacillus spongiae]|uniref:histidine kinase n=1 Tax=Bacillus spongiae TaxID=2683610 RepID=A0ABU8HH63_9BACI
MRKIFRSLLAKYMFIILMALSLVQLTYILIAVFVSEVTKDTEDKSQSQGYEGFEEVEEKWHQEAKDIQNVTVQTVDQHFYEWTQQYADASMFWVGEDGKLLTTVNLKDQLPSEWTPAFTTKFIKERYGGDPFTIIAFLGENETNGFIVLEVPRSTFNPPLRDVYDNYGSILFIGVILIIFLFITASFLFFRGIRKRLVKLQDAMELRDVDNLPIQINVKKQDEIGQLEQTFNQMVFELRESKQREQKEEQLRRELIANLSHDLRTPLTKVRAQTYSIAKEDLSADGKRAIKALEASVVNIDSLIENLMSYSLLMASKYKCDRKAIDVVRFVRKSLASWYPVFEKAGFEIDIELNVFKETKWLVDPIWLGRILDNLFQNVVRHARSGQYIGVKTESKDNIDSLIIIDRGKGMNDESNEKGAGIGLSIVDMMVKGMDLDWDIESSEQGTTITIKKYNERCS